MVSVLTTMMPTLVNMMTLHGVFLLIMDTNVPIMTNVPTQITTIVIKNMPIAMTLKVPTPTHVILDGQILTMRVQHTMTLMYVLMGPIHVILIQLASIQWTATYAIVTKWGTSPPTQYRIRLIPVPHGLEHDSHDCQAEKYGQTVALHSAPYSIVVVLVHLS